MKHCNVCGGTEFHPEALEEMFRMDGHLAVVEHVPAMVCSRCGEATFDADTVERVREMLRSGQRPTRSVDVDVFAFT